MKLLVRLFFLLVAGALAHMPAFAQSPDVMDAYRGRAPLTAETAEQKNLALRAALQQVLTRVSGTAYSADSGRMTPILDRANSLLRGISYETDDKGSRLLVASFNPSAVEESLKQAGLPVWGMLAGNIEEVELRISGVNSPGAYALALSSLQNLPMVKSLNITESAEGTLFLRLQVEGGAGRLAGALTVTQTLRREPSEPGALAYRLSRS